MSSSVASRSVGTRPAGSRSGAGRARSRNGLTHAVLIVASLLMIFPFVWQILMSLATNAQVTSVPPTIWPGTLHFENFAHVFDQLPFLNQLWVSVAVTVIRTVGQLLLCSMAGYAFARMEFPFRRTIFALVLAILMVPPQVYLLPQYQIIQGLGWLNTTIGLVAPGLFSAFGTFLMRTAFISLPRELEDAARVDGANPFQTFWRIMLPLVKPTISVLAITTVLFSWNELLWPLVVTTRSETMPLAAGLATLSSDHRIDYPVLMAASLMAMAPILIAFIALQRRVIEGLASSGLK